MLRSQSQKNGRERAYYTGPVKRSLDMVKTIEKLRFFRAAAGVR